LVDQVWLWRGRHLDCRESWIDETLNRCPVE
jgi:hypothetical protein